MTSPYAMWGTVGNEAYAVPLVSQTPVDPLTQGYVLAWDIVNQAVGWFPLSFDANGNANLAGNLSLSTGKTFSIGSTVIAGASGNLFSVLTVAGISYLGGAVGTESLRVNSIPGGVNRVEISGNLATFMPTIAAAGTDTNVGISYVGKGAGIHGFYVNNAAQFAVNGPSNAVNYGEIDGSIVGSPVVLSALGADTNIALRLSNKGTAVTELTGQTVGTAVGAAGGATALPATPLGYLTVKLNGGANVRIPYYN